MTTATPNKLLILLPLVGALLALEASSAAAQDRELRLFARLAGPTKASGSAKYEARSDRRKFSVEVEDAFPGQPLLVTVRRGDQHVQIGFVSINQFGMGDMNLDSRRGDIVPQLQNNDVVQVWSPDKRILAGPLHQQ